MTNPYMWAVNFSGGYVEYGVFVRGVATTRCHIRVLVEV